MKRNFTRLLITIAALLSMAFFATFAFALTPGSGTWKKETATYSDGWFRWLPDAYVYVPSNPNPAVLNGKRALMVSLPGCTMSAANIINHGFNWETTAEQYGMVVITASIPPLGVRIPGCWDFYPGQSRGTRDAVPLMKFVNAIKARTGLDIDPKQVYVSGLSSGAAMTHILGCEYPDVFAATIPNASSTLGDAITPQQVADNCKAMSGNNYNSYFNTQLFANVYGALDPLAGALPNLINREGMKILYNATTSAGTQDVPGGGGGTVDLWKDSNNKIRVGNQVVWLMGHAWPAGQGGYGGGLFVDYNDVNFPAYIVPWVFTNNLRVTR